jgi:D-beta-D-heptose 7-phosphate kinase/D-beta-D-heptose 1-phosphate adenosyltransferase
MTGDLLTRLSSLRIAVVGDLMLDHYLWGDTHRISPEAPVPVVEIHRETYTAGGAANVALNLASLGVNVELCGILGEDLAAGRLRSVLLDKGIHLDAGFSAPGFKTIIKTRVLVQQQQLCRLDVEQPPHEHCLDRNGMLSLCLDRIRQCDAVIVSDYAKGVVTQALVDHVRQIAVEAGIFLAADPKPKRHLDFSGFGVMTPNRSEALQLAGMPELRHGEEFPAEVVGRAIFEKYSPRSLVVTLGADGMMIYHSADDRRHIPTAAKEVFDVSGAGDTVVAVLTASLAAGLSLEEAAHVANVAAGVVVAKLGTAIVTPEELGRQLELVDWKP